MVNREEFVLSNEKIFEISSKCYSFYKDSFNPKRQYGENVVTLNFEEILIQLQSAYGKEAKCTVLYRKSIFGAKVTFIVKGAEINPFALENEELSYSRHILQACDVVPDYRYNRDSDTNEITVELQQKPIKNKMLISILLAVVLAVICRLLLGHLSADTLGMLKESIINPVFSKLTAVITGVATFLVFFSVITGITGVGNSVALGNMGSKLLKAAGVTYFFTAVVLSTTSCILYQVSTISSSGNNVVKDLVQLVLDMIPSNLLECFVLDNDLQVVVLAVFVGLVLLIMGEKVSQLNEMIFTLSEVINVMMATICKALPVVVFFGILNMLLGDVSEVIRVYKVALIFAISSVLIICFLFIKLKLTIKVSLMELFKMQWPTTLINLATSSQVAAMPESIKCCKEKFKIDSNFVDFSLPLCVVTYMPCGAAFLGALVYGMADITGVPVDITFVIKLAVMSVIVAIAAPPIPGSAFAVMPIMMAGCGVPDTYYFVAIVLGTILGYFLPALNGYCMQLEVLYAAHKLNLVGKENIEGC